MRHWLSLRRVDFWWWIHKHGDWLLAYDRYHRANRNHERRYRENIYGEPINRRFPPERPIPWRIR